jgi:hypothetical protein
MHRFIAILLIISLGSALQAAGNENASPASSKYLQSVVISRRQVVGNLRGVVRAPDGEPLEGVEVDVLNHPEWIIKGQSGSPSEQRVLASQVTDGNGRFTFKGLPAGAYEVRFGKPMFEQQHLYVEVRPRTRRKKRLKIALGLAI